MNLKEKFERVALYFFEKEKRDITFLVFVNEICEEHKKLTDMVIDERINRIKRINKIKKAIVTNSQTESKDKK